MVRPRIGPISRHSASPATDVRGPAPSQAQVLVDLRPRSRRYLDGLARLDAGTNVTAARLEEIVAEIHREFTERWAALPLGIVSRCYLGHPYEVHTLAPDGGIVEHYQVGGTLPGPLERARGASLTGLYLAVEVYADRLVCLRTDGSTVTLGGGDA